MIVLLHSTFQDKLYVMFDDVIVYEKYKVNPGVFLFGMRRLMNIVLGPLICYTIQVIHRVRKLLV